MIMKIKPHPDVSAECFKPDDASTNGTANLMMIGKNTVGINWPMILHKQNSNDKTCSLVYFAYFRGVADAMRAEVNVNDLLSKPEKDGGWWPTVRYLLAMYGILSIIMSF